MTDSPIRRALPLDAMTDSPIRRALPLEPFPSPRVLFITSSTLFKHVASTSRRPSIAVPAVTQPATAAPAASKHPPLLYLLPPSLPSPYPPPSLPLPYFLPLPSLLSLFCLTLPPRSLPSPYLPPPSRAAHSLPSPTRRTFRRHSASLSQ